MVHARFTLFSAAIAAILVGPALATNHFAGLTASNSASSSTYTCRTQAQWNQLATDAKSQGFGAIRILAFDCNALDLASSAAAAAGIKVLAGIYISGTVAAGATQINNDVQTFRAAYQKYGSGRYIGLTIGNEVNDTPANIMQKVYDVRGYLASIGVKIPVSTVHTWVMIRDNPTLCGADFVGANAQQVSIPCLNAHIQLIFLFLSAFYDGGRTSSQAGDFVFNTAVPSLKQKCPGKKVYITESGWPSRGPKFGTSAVASIADETNAIRSLNCAARGDTSVSVFAFEYDDQLWKSNDNERSFGIFGGKLNLNNVLSSC
ncbi:glycoside hydrolase superfamily [Flammula alnicola]|nr:glycoside hydrolase superfamily [Flammula alnicola]